MTKTYEEKLHNSKDPPKVVVLDEKAKRLGVEPGDKMLIAPATDYDAIMKHIPKGKLTTTDRIRVSLAKQAGAQVTCPLTAGIFVNIAAGASGERAGVDPTPWWRTLKRDGELNPKYPEGIAVQKALLEDEGHSVIQRGKRLFVENYEDALFTL